MIGQALAIDDVRVSDGMGADELALERLEAECRGINVKLLYGGNEMPCCIIFDPVKRILIINQDATELDIEDAIKYIHNTSLR